jgi:RimJ/RimL family protein N-acetyltransferase
VYKQSRSPSSLNIPPGVELQPLDKDLLERAEQFKLEIGSRFWASSDDFLKHGLGVCAIKDGEIISLCYSACVVDGLAEVDIITDPEFRGGGYGRLAAQALIELCRQHQIAPTWDCFIQNTSSMKLAAKLGFEQTHAYPLYSFNPPLPLQKIQKEADQNEMA